MLGSLENLQVVDAQALPKAALGKHAADGLLEDALGEAVAQALEGLELPSSGLAGTGALVGGVAEVRLVGLLVTGDGDLVRIDDNDVGTHVHRRVVRREVLPANGAGGQARKATEGLRTRGRGEMGGQVRLGAGS